MVLSRDGWTVSFRVDFGWCFKPALFNSKVLFLQQNTIFVCLEIVSLKAYLHVSLYNILISCNSSYQKIPKKNNPLWNQEPTGEKKMLFFSQVDLQLTGGTKCTETFQKNSQMFITSHRLPQRIVACCVGISEIVLFKPKKMFDFILKSFLDALFITRRPP